mmetsp:Transcript_7457/g.16033  ORF Transcript_7457/g.16033 Transcript_7457/m.16033 type:complete len:410 (-) Transcript_7457:133-1362(-)|eukprot:CAMPEP_0168193644 /NCGR_PEP_ID=MMETSP0139_2-20121125/18721_1 /TAXON_ID=44445 /ORGANISM="Pseudo-nitzschia australis, Strain 10249 10 AB" /LENGTH=409 /DNA_ID=CAMNT_0008117023 /DNA_START=142 /DNA_END=1371 /DNA_ORIENTATION=-
MEVILKIFFVLVLHYYSGYARASNAMNFNIRYDETYDGDTSDRRELAGLAEKWNLTENGVKFQGMNFEMRYIVSDFILDSMMQAIPYTVECQELGTEIPFSHMSYNLNFDDTPPGDGNLERAVYLNITVNPDIENSLAYKDVYNETTGELTAEVDFCVRFSLYTSTSTPIEANFLESIVGFKADLTSGFSIDTVQVAPKEKTVTTSVENYEVEAFLCDNENLPLGGSALTKARTQGELIRACVTPTQIAQEDGVLIKAIEEFTWYRDYEGALGRVSQVAVEDSREASNSLSLLYCTPGSVICAFESMLFSSMFLTQGEVSGAGTALLQLGGGDESSGTRGRDLVESPSKSRSLQGGIVDPTSKFGLNYELRLGDPSIGSLKTSSSQKISLIYSFITMGVIASLNLISII